MTETKTGEPASSMTVATLRRQLMSNFNVSHPENGDIVHGRYTVIDKLGEGGFGAVYEVERFATGEHYAMKIELEKPMEDEIGMEVEAIVLKRGQGLSHFLRYIDEGTHGTFSFFVMQIAGPSLSDLQKKCRRRRFSNDTATRLAVQCLEATENIHIVGFLHRDIKPSNFLMGAPGSVDARTVYILDFGLVRRYRLKDGRVRPQRESAGFRGSYQFASINAHLGKDLGRRDDMWSLLYSVIHMRVGKLAWRKLSHSDDICQTKSDISREELLRHMEPEYGPFYEHITHLRYSHCPDYEFLRNQIEKIWRRKNYSHQTLFDWEREPGDLDQENNDCDEVGPSHDKSSTKSSYQDCLCDDYTNDISYNENGENVSEPPPPSETSYSSASGECCSNSDCRSSISCSSFCSYDQEASNDGDGTILTTCPEKSSVVASTYQADDVKVSATNSNGQCCNDENNISQDQNSSSVDVEVDKRMIAIL